MQCAAFGACHLSFPKAFMAFGTSYLSSSTVFTALGASLEISPHLGKHNENSLCGSIHNLRRNIAHSKVHPPALVVYEGTLIISKDASALPPCSLPSILGHVRDNPRPRSHSSPRKEAFLHFLLSSLPTSFLPHSKHIL